MELTLGRLPWPLLKRELAFVAIALVLVTAPSFFSLGEVAWMALGGLLAIAAFHPRALVFTVPAAIPLSFQPFELGDLQFNMLEILVVALAIGYLPRAAVAVWELRRAGNDQRRTVIRTAIPDLLAAAAALILLAAGLASFAWMADVAHAPESLRTSRRTILIPVTYFFMAAPVIQQSNLYRGLAIALFLTSAVVASAIAVVDGVSGGGVQADSVTRISGIAPHPNALALVLDRAAVLGLLTGMLFRNRLAAHWMVPSVFVAVTVMLTFSRGAMLGVVAGCVIILLLARARKIAVLFVTLSGTGLAGLIAIAPDRTLSILGGGSGSLRLELWRSAVRMIQDHPVTGVGPDQFLYQYLPRYVSPEAWPERFTSHPHNLIFDTWLSLGIIGLIVLGLVGALVFRHLRGGLAAQDRISLAAAGSLVTVTTHGMVDQSYFLPELAMSVWFLVILLKPGPETLGTTQHRAGTSESEG